MTALEVSIGKKKWHNEEYKESIWLYNWDAIAAANADAYTSATGIL